MGGLAAMRWSTGCDGNTRCLRSGCNSMLGRIQDVQCGVELPFIALCLVIIESHELSHTEQRLLIL